MDFGVAMASGNLGVLMVSGGSEADDRGVNRGIGNGEANGAGVGLNALFAVFGIAASFIGR